MKLCLIFLQIAASGRNRHFVFVTKTIELFKNYFQNPSKSISLFVRVSWKISLVLQNVLGNDSFAVKQKNRIKANIDISVTFCKLVEVHMHFLRYLNYDLVSIASQNFCYYLSKERFLRVCLSCPTVNCSKQSFRGQCLDITQPSESYDTEFLTGSFLQIIVYRTKSFHL